MACLRPELRTRHGASERQPRNGARSAAKAASSNGLYFLVLKRMADELKPFSSETHARLDEVRL
ncbi:MAG: hypothetical protein MZV70_53440 [Desulfobacterales bacterium]|nr:hypothetical protein [Desulfobacterales bacterium]